MIGMSKQNKEVPGNGGSEVAAEIARQRAVDSNPYAIAAAAVAEVGRREDAKWVVSAAALNARFGSQGYIPVDQLKTFIEKMRRKA
jgi:hypothetical protein